MNDEYFTIILKLSCYGLHYLHCVFTRNMYEEKEKVD